jgi:hypothetical protein
LWGVIVALVLASTGCGGGGEAAPASSPGPSEQLLSRKDVGKYKGGTPERALLVWWRAIQYGDFSAYLSGFTKDVRIALRASARAKRDLNYLSGALRVARPKIVGVEAGAGGVTVYTNISYRQPVGSSTYTTSTQPRAFSMVFQRGAWRLTDDSFVRSFFERLK